MFLHKPREPSVATVSRTISSIKCLYAHFFIKQLITLNPAQGLTPEKVPQKLPEILTNREVELLLAQPNCIDPKGYRDKAMLELLYATGIRVTELIDLKITDVNLEAGVIRCASREKERLIHPSDVAYQAVIVGQQIIVVSFCYQKRKNSPASIRLKVEGANSFPDQKCNYN